ncbi:hypothetical protein KUTeg_006990 [Tegillarca granosa]|uniref:Origin recognition complex subunit 3 insertion domain-containing protein n=1 Tax=Tegillarca granosa TaxID=220873 RepID=A0ABQ9FBX4_TEGGR|nr:hypothetical protein KUTeg_006990 [Tegillarca granosa]
MAEWPSVLSEFVKPIDDIITKFENIDVCFILFIFSKDVKFYYIIIFLIVLNSFLAVEEEEEDSPSDDTTGKNQVVLQKTDMYKLRQNNKKKNNFNNKILNTIVFETLEEMKMKKRKQTPYEKLRDNTLQYFDKYFRKYLLCPKKLPLHEIVYYESYIAVKQHLNAAPRSAIQTALSNPHHYLQVCNSCHYLQVNNARHYLQN